ncbi:multidrug/biocide efflux PACE transporter [Burkholderia sp. F1]|uniref:multidrug/biocide efflux PACE transporter n=1 Tax=Burkholderia sp. F1 TaxID=3366817 RepID=UPI003D73AC2B
MKHTNKTLMERLVHALTFELVAIALCAPLGAWLLDMPVAHVGALTVMVSLIAMAWNMTFNTLFDRLERRFGWVRNVGLRIVHAVAFELGLVAMVVPLAAWWLGIGLVEALLLDLGIVLFFLPYTFCFNLAYDSLRARRLARRVAA